MTRSFLQDVAKTMLSHPLIETIERHLQAGQLGQASALLGQMHERHEGLDKYWLDCLGVLVSKLDAAGFRPQAQHWLGLAGPVARSIGLHPQPPLPMPGHLTETVFDEFLGKSLKRYPAFEGPDAYVYAIEVAGTCNLRCPSCPVGNMPDEPKPTGLMDFSVFEKILNKIASERPTTPIVVHLFNWGEPLLHPELDKFIQAIRHRNWKCIVSTTLNISRGLDRLVKAAPDVLKVSLSGWSQNEYEQTHKRGNIERVKTNLHELKKLLADRSPEQATKDPIYVMLGYHLYQHNLNSAQKVRQLAQELGFHYTENNAVIQPIERNLDLLAGRADPITREIAQKLLVHPREISRLNRQRRSGQFDCELRFNMTAINVDTSVALCCGTFSRSLQIHGSFLDADLQDLERSKYASSFCAECMHCGFAYTVNDVM